MKGKTMSEVKLLKEYVYEINQDYTQRMSVLARDRDEADIIAQKIIQDTDCELKLIIVREIHELQEELTATA